LVLRLHQLLLLLVVVVVVENLFYAIGWLIIEQLAS
jgi:hypothetical protein